MGFAKHAGCGLGASVPGKDARRGLAPAWAGLQISLGKGWAPDQNPAAAASAVSE
ncbi:hypothetical protein METH_21535 (plasmid) [Leisingera methylohalidivorans DSM 14336]|uniref:Uncharacterized protein n=1 Tax=Leisingera methylohalidivorans DSM 14336 TaxID=999552 RepID=V9W169_9RHOB|nr:hypothetical protein METH_21535 [Leisingera methylohalidivorans DSM 14336]